MNSLKLHKKILISFLLVLCLWCGGLVWFYLQIPKEKTAITIEKASIILVLTGDSGRLEYGLELLAGNQNNILFISGVGKNVTISDILRQIPETIPEERRKQINETRIITGNKAENTIGNAAEIREWLQSFSAQHTEYKNIVLVTSSYHMPRSLLELSEVIPEISIIPAPVIVKNNDLLLSEYHKYVASKLRHIFIYLTQKK